MLLFTILAILFECCSASLIAWAGPLAVEVTTNAPVLRWNTTIRVSQAAATGGNAILAFRLNVTGTNVSWSTGEVRQTLLSTWTGLAVYEGPALRASSSYVWSVEEHWVAYSNGTGASTPLHVVATGRFVTATSLPSAKTEAADAMRSANVSKLWTGSWHSVAGRVQASGFLPTSVSGGYGGITSQFPRDASGQLMGLLELGPSQYPTVEKALRFMLGQLKSFYEPGHSFNSYAPHVMHGDKNLTKIISLETTDQTDDTFYIIAAWGHYLALTNDTAMERDFYFLLRNYTLHYLAPEARSLGSGGTVKKPEKGGGVLYWNESLSLLWNANLEHSRLGSYWSAYDTLTNSFAVEGLRVLAAAAEHMGIADDVQQWRYLRSRILHGIDTSLTTEDEMGNPIYAELRGHPNDFSEDKTQVGYSPLLWGLSYENVVAMVLGLSGMKASSPADMSSLGLDVQRLDNTWAVYRRLGSFQWVNEDPAQSAFVPTTHINASGYSSPPVGTRMQGWCDYTGNWKQMPSCPAYRGATCACPSFAVIGKGLGWELGWAAYRKWYTRLISLHRWLGAAAHVEQTDLFGESYVYECIKSGERTGFKPITPSNPRGSGCWGDPGNGVQIGWFLWGEALARQAVGLAPTDTAKPGSSAYI